MLNDSKLWRIFFFSVKIKKSVNPQKICKPHKLCEHVEEKKFTITWKNDLP